MTGLLGKTFRKPFIALLIVLGFLVLLSERFDSLSYAAGIRQVTIGTAGSKGTWYVKGSLIAKILSGHFPNVRVTAVVSPGQSNENIRRIQERDMEMALSSAKPAFDAYHGIDIFAPKKHDIFSWFAETEAGWVVMVKEDSKINSIYDLRGKKIAMPPRAETNYDLLVKSLLPLYGLKKGDYSVS